MKKNILNILLILILFFFFSSFIVLKPLRSLDEIWNFNFSNNMANGLIPYKDFNMITTPLLPMICQLFLRLFGKQLLVMRFLAAILSTTIFYMSYLIFNTLFDNKNNNISFFLTLITAIFCINTLCIDYNWATLLIGLILLLIELKNYKLNNKIIDYNLKKDFIIGFISGLAILFKQSTGLIISIACIGYKLLDLKSKKEIKILLKIIITRLIGAIIPCILLFIYLLYNNALQDFIDYTILGISSFSNKINYIDFLTYNKDLQLLAIIVPFAIITIFINYLKTKNKKSLILFTYSITNFIVVYPIADKVHFTIGSLIPLIIISYYLATKLLHIIKHKQNIYIKKISYICISVEMIFILTISISSFIKYNTAKKNEYIYAFSNIIIDKTLETNIETINNYILKKQQSGKEVYILDSTAALYMIPLQKHNKDFDLFLKGNLGSKSETRIIEKIKNNKNKIYLIKKKQELRSWQSPEKIISYIKENLVRTGEIGEFETYEN